MDHNKKIIAREDLDLLVNHLKKRKTITIDKDGNGISDFIANAELIDGNDFPWEIVRLNSKVIIRDKLARLNYAYTVVMPEQADHKQCKVSVFSAIGRALFGNRRGDDIHWETPNGKRYFTIVAVSQYPN